MNNCLSRFSLTLFVFCLTSCGETPSPILSETCTAYLPQSSVASVRPGLVQYGQSNECSYFSSLRSGHLAITIHMTPIPVSSLAISIGTLTYSVNSQDIVIPTAPSNGQRTPELPLDDAVVSATLSYDTRFLGSATPPSSISITLSAQ